MVLDGPVIAASALQHGLEEDEILHAYRNPIRVWGSGEGFTMMIGANAAAIFLEVGYVQAVLALRSAVQERSAAERHIVAAVRQARQVGLSWSAIGALVGTSGEAARQRYAHKAA